MKIHCFYSPSLFPRVGISFSRAGVLSLSAVLATVLASGMGAMAAFGQSAYPDGTAQPAPTIPAAAAKAPGQAGGQSGGQTGGQSGGQAGGQLGGQTGGQSREGFWGHMNPFARKKWVNRQVEPLREKTNELDEVTAKNANDIRDVDSRSQAGVNHALNAADLADQHAVDARNRADAAQGLANDASSRTDSLNGTVSGLDQYEKVVSVPVRFVAGRTTLGPRARAQLDTLAAKIVDQKGYIIDVQGYSPEGVQRSEAMADAVTRYLVTRHQVPLHRIYRAGLGRNTRGRTGGGPAIANGVQVSLLHNSLSSLGASGASVAPAVASAHARVEARP